ncbi:MAG: hypothetical protein HFH47_03100 [Bacilli bacterium]|nr:hypothetical protein [Bacilli bacterium]
MSHKKKRNIIIGTLCGVLLLMIVGYAAFQSVLNIKGTSSINSNWDIKITEIKRDSSSISGVTDVEGFPKINENSNELSASFNTNLEYPGVYATYKIEITNNGSLNAVLKNINITESQNKDIVFYLNKNYKNEPIEDGLKQNDILYKQGETGNVGYVYVTVLYRNYDDQKGPENTEANITISFDFEQVPSKNTPSGNIITPGDLTANPVTSGDGLYADTYENGRYVYKGANPNNYITFNGEPWRIVAIEKDGSLKIMKRTTIGTQKFDTTGQYGSNNWARPAYLNTYLNDVNDENSYYNTLGDSKKLIQEYTWNIGPVAPDNNDLPHQVELEKSKTWNGNIGLITVSDYLKANTNIEQCGNLELNNSNAWTCKQTNYLSLFDSRYWTISSYLNYAALEFVINSSGQVAQSDATAEFSVAPVLYLKPDIKLSGDGTNYNSYEIVQE